MRITPDQEPIFTLTTGPVDAYPQVLQGLSRPVLYDYDPAFLAFYERTVEKLRTAFRTPHVPVILQGEPVLALEAGAASLIARDDVVLNLVSGVYGAGFGFWAKRYCAELIEIRVPYDEVIDPDRVAALLKARPEIRVVSVCHHDTPSGTINPVAEIGRIVAAHGAYLLVDAVSSFGGMEVGPDSCQADLFVTGPNKCLGCPPGLSLVGVTPRAWDKMKSNPHAPRDSMLSILDWEHAWRRDRPFPFTPSVSEINGLDAALDLYLKEGPEACLGPTCAHRRGLPCRHSRDGPVSVACRGAHRLADHDRRAHPGRHRGCRAPSGRARTLRGGVLVGTRRDARQARAHRPHGTDREAAVRGGGPDRARRRDPRVRPPARRGRRRWRRRSRPSTGASIDLALGSGETQVDPAILEPITDMVRAAPHRPYRSTVEVLMNAGSWKAAFWAVVLSWGVPAGAWAADPASDVPSASDLLLLHGHIYTGAKNAPWAEALSVTGSRIDAVGADAELLARRGPSTRVIDLHGRTVIPGHRRCAYSRLARSDRTAWIQFVDARSEHHAVEAQAPDRADPRLCRAAIRRTI